MNQRTNFLSYNNPSPDDARLFMVANLHFYLRDAHACLFKNPKARSYIKFEDLNHNDKELHFINSCITYLLELIGEYSNSRFGMTASGQHRFFGRPNEQITFFPCLFLAIQAHKQKIIIKAKPESEAPLMASRVNDAYLDLKMFEGKKTGFFKVAGKYISEKQLYAAGVFYAMNFIFDAIRANDALKLSQLLAHLQHFKSGPTYLAAYGKKGGKKTKEKRNNKRDTAYALFMKYNVYQKLGPGHEAMISELIPILRRHHIAVSPATLKTRWVPLFVTQIKLTTC
jgi:hypothetical protein